MNYEFSREDKARIGRFEALFDSESAGLTSALSARTPAENGAMLRTWQSRLAGEGYFAAGTEDALSGVLLAAVREVAAQRAPSLFFATEMGVRLFGQLVCSLDESASRTEILAGLSEGRVLGAPAERDNEVEAHATDRGLALTGTAPGVLNGPVADWYAIPFSLEDRCHICLIPRDDPAVACSPWWALPGFRGVLACDLNFENCMVSQEMILGPGEDGAIIVEQWEDDVLAIAALGVMHRCLEAATGEARSRKRGGKPLIAYQEVSFALAEMLTMLDTARLLVYRAAWLAETAASDAAVVAHCARAFSADSARQVADLALQVVGPPGLMGGHAVEESLCDARYLQVAGTPFTQAQLKIGEALLG